MKESLHLVEPSLVKKTLMSLHLREINPRDICPNEETWKELLKTYPDLDGDWTAIGNGDDGNCQSWRGDWNWWKEIVYPKKP